jgi:hypothetical protein
MRPLALTPLLLALAVGCGPSEDRFVADLAEGDCLYALACFEDGVLNQYGWTDQETCVQDRGSRIAARAASCSEFDRKLARECLDGLELRNCADRTGPDDFGRPAACEAVFTSCEGGDTSPGDGVDTDDPVDDTDA